MTNKPSATRTAMLAATLFMALCGLSLQLSAADLGSDAAARLNKKQYQNVKVTVNNGTATLTGTVDLYITANHGTDNANS